MGNKSSCGRHQQFSARANGSESLDQLDIDQETHGKTLEPATPFIGDVYVDLQSPDVRGDLSPATITPPHLRSRLVGAEVFKPRPQSDELIVVRNDAIKAEEEASSLLHGVDPKLESAIASPLAVATPRPSAANDAATLFTESSPINIIAIKSKVPEGKRPIKRSPRKPLAAPAQNLKATSEGANDKPINPAPVARENEGHLSPSASLKGDGSNANRQEKGRPTARTRVVVGCALLLLLLFYSACLAAVGWVGMQAAKGLLLSPPSRLNDPLTLAEPRVARIPPPDPVLSILDNGEVYLSHLPQQHILTLFSGDLRSRTTTLLQEKAKDVGGAGRKTKVWLRQKTMALADQVQPVTVSAVEWVAALDLQSKLCRFLSQSTPSLRSAKLLFRKEIDGINDGSVLMI